MFFLSSSLILFCFFLIPNFVYREIYILGLIPLIILMIGYSPLILELLYTKEFSEAQNLLKILLFADIIKVVSFPVGFAILGLGDSDAVKRQGPTQLMLLVALVYFFLPILYLMILIPFSIYVFHHPILLIHHFFVQYRFPMILFLMLIHQ